MKRHSKITLVMCVIVALSALCLSSVALAGGPKYGGTLRIGLRMPQFHRMDVRYTTLETMVPAMGMIYDRLFNWGPDGFKSLSPALATRYETKDNKIWILHLRKGVKFHNGREMTAEDVKTNLEWRIKTPPGWKPVKFRELIKYLKAVEVVDKYTVKIILEKPYAPLMRVMTYAVRGIAPPEEVEKWGKKFQSHPCGTGPYKIVSIRPKEKVVIERFEDYWGPRPYIDRVEYIPIRSDEARLIALEKGDVDMAQLLDIARPILEKDPNLEYQAARNSLVLHKHYFNFRRWPMNDIRFRKAIWMGADWKNICINIRAFKSGVYARTLLEYSPYFNPEALKLVPAYDPEKARKLIKAVERDAGKKIPPIYWLDSNRPTGRRIAEPAKLQLAQIGVTLDVHLLSHAIWYEKVLRDPKIEWDTAGYGIGFAVDPSLGFRYFETNSGVAPDGKSLGGYSNPEFDRWLEKAESARSGEERKRAYQEAEKILLKDVAAIPLSGYRMVIGYNKKVKGFKINDTLNIYVCNPYSNLWIEE
ncbi:MAG: ABC transporter substrate-binding protein [Deltaproteobacteria bacterium]|nr:ABC transporter substrate-binding protein [Deltaproteobacteria bacterium]